MSTVCTYTLNFKYQLLINLQFLINVMITIIPNLTHSPAQAPIGAQG